MNSLIFLKTPQGVSLRFLLSLQVRGQGCTTLISKFAGRTREEKSQSECCFRWSVVLPSFLLPVSSFLHAILALSLCHMRNDVRLKAEVKSSRYSRWRIQFQASALKAVGLYCFCFLTCLDNNRNSNVNECKLILDDSAPSLFNFPSNLVETNACCYL